MKKSTKFAATLGCLSLALVGGLVMTACGPKTKEIQKEDFDKYIAAETTVKHLDKGLHMVSTTTEAEETTKEETWILKSGNSYEVKTEVKTLAGTDWTLSSSYYLKDNMGYMYDVDSEQKTKSEDDGNDYDQFFKTDIISDLLDQLDAFTEEENGSVKYYLKEDKKVKTYTVEASKTETEKTDSSKVTLEFKNDKLVKLSAESKTEIEASTNSNSTMEEFNGTITAPADLDQYKREDGFVEVGDLATFKTEIVKADAKVILTEDIELDTNITIANKAELNLDGHKITIKEDVNFVDMTAEGVHTWAMFAIEGENADLTVSGNGTIESRNSLAVFNVGTRGDKTTGTGSAAGKLTIKDGTFINNGAYTEKGNDMEDILIFVDKGGNLTIEGGTFKMKYGDKKIEQNAETETDNSKDEKIAAKKLMIDARDKENTAKIEIKGGTFYFFNPEVGDSVQQDKFVPEGFKAEETEADSGIYKVVADPQE